MDLRELTKQAEHLIKRNSPAILTGLGVTGTITTAYLASRATLEVSGTLLDKSYGFSKRQKAKLVWKKYIPAVATGTATIGCIVFATRINSKRTAALAAAYSLSERAFIDYKDKVVEQLGERKEQKVRDEVAQDHVRATAPGPSVVLSGYGDILCCELYTGRYFKSDMEKLRKAQNDLNAELILNGLSSLSDFYHLVGLAKTSNSDHIGWVEQLMELQFSHALTDDGRPCLTFEYNYTKPILIKE